MIYALSGPLEQPAPGVLIVTCGGVSFACAVSRNTQAALQGVHEGRVYTHLAVREDAMELFAFADLAEKQCFLSLIGVSGVGPKAALAVLSALTPASFATAVVTGDAKAISQAKGVGPKLAQRMVLELKDKMAKEQPGISGGSGLAGLSGLPALPVGDGTGEAMQALLVLGYSSQEAQRALDKVMAAPDAPTDAGEQIRQCLRLLS